MKEAEKKNLRLVLEYDGSRYDGWQKQGNTGNTIQGRLEQVLERMTGQTAEVHGSGRTDGGVHALGQVANAHIATDLRPEEILSYVNRYLPEDIRVLQVDFAPERFHSRLNAEEKTYRYVLDTAPKTDVFRAALTGFCMMHLKNTSRLCLLLGNKSSVFLFAGSKYPQNYQQSVGAP